MIFNGLTGTDLMVFNALYEQDLPASTPISKLSRLTGYHPETVRRALNRLVGYEIVARHRERRGQPYTYEVIDDYAFPDS